MRYAAVLLVASLLAACAAPGSPSPYSRRVVALATDFDLPVGAKVESHVATLRVEWLP
jgi:hypothetical protein